MTAFALLTEAAEAGGRVFLKNGRVRVSSDAGPLPAELVESLRAAKEQIADILAVVPEEWIAGHVKLVAMERPRSYPADLWDHLLFNARGFLETWASQSAHMGWSTVDLFGVHKAAPANRYDCMGLIPMIGRHALVSIDKDSATLGCVSGASLKYRRKPFVWRAEQCLVWDLAAHHNEGED